MNRITAIDEKLISAVQDGYLWLYDRTGVYLATCCVALVLSGEALHQMHNRSIATIILTGLICLGFFQLYLLQMRGNKATLNAFARAWRSSKIRNLFCWWMILLAFIPPWPILDMLDSVFCWLAIAYGQAVQIRDRQPKEFFPSRQPARVAASS